MSKLLVAEAKSMTWWQLCVPETSWHTPPTIPPLHVPLTLFSGRNSSMGNTRHARWWSHDLGRQIQVRYCIEEHSNVNTFTLLPVTPSLPILTVQLRSQGQRILVSVAAAVFRVLRARRCKMWASVAYWEHQKFSEPQVCNYKIMFICQPNLWAQKYERE